MNDPHSDSTGNQGTGSSNGRPQAEARRWRKRKLLEPTGIWLIPVSGFATSAIGTTVAALTISATAAIRASELWVATGGLVLAAILCLVAHIHVNHGRKVEEYVLEELPTEASL